MASGKPKKKNPRLASGRKRARQDVKLNSANTSLRSKYRTAVKNVEKAVAAGDKAKATAFSTFFTAVRYLERRDVFAAFSFTSWRARLRPDARRGFFFLGLPEAMECSLNV